MPTVEVYGQKIQVDGIYKSCSDHHKLKLEGKRDPKDRGQRNWWCKKCEKFFMGPGGTVKGWMK